MISGESEDTSIVIDREEAVVFRLGEAEYGVSIHEVDEVLRVPPLTRVPFPPPDVIGVIGSRGEILPVLDLGARLGVGPARRDGRLLVVTVGEEEETVAVLVDEVTGLADIATRLEDPPSDIEDSLPTGWVQMVLAPNEERLITVLDIERLLRKDRTEKDSS